MVVFRSCADEKKDYFFDFGAHDRIFIEAEEVFLFDNLLYQFFLRIQSFSDRLSQSFPKDCFTIWNINKTYCCFVNNYPRSVFSSDEKL